MLKGVIFDLDGVLVDSHPIHMRAWKKFLASLDIVASAPELEILRDGRSKEEILRHFISDLTGHEICAYAEEKDRFYREEVRGLTTVKGIRRLLDQLRRNGVPAAVASSGSFWRVHDTLDRLHLKDYFTTVVTAKEFKAGKSNPAIFLNTAQRMEVRCDESLVFEDSAAGIRSATAIGIKCIGIADHVREKALLDAGAVLVFRNFVHTSLTQLQGLFIGTPNCKWASHASSLSA